MPKLTDGQFHALDYLRGRSEDIAEEIARPLGMDGKRRFTLRCNWVTSATLARLDADGLVSIERGEIERPVDAVGRNGNPRRKLTIKITAKGLEAIDAA